MVEVPIGRSLFFLLFAFRFEFFLGEEAVAIFVQFGESFLGFSFVFAAGYEFGQADFAIVVGIEMLGTLSFLSLEAADGAGEDEGEKDCKFGFHIVFWFD